MHFLGDCCKVSHLGTSVAHHLATSPSSACSVKSFSTYLPISHKKQLSESLSLHHCVIYVGRLGVGESGVCTMQERKEKVCGRWKS